MNAITPGPWATSGLAIYSASRLPHRVTQYGARERFVAQVESFDTSDHETELEARDLNLADYAEAEANARAIAAVPDMIAACQTAAELLSDPDPADNARVLAVLMAALSKALGTQGGGR